MSHRRSRRALACAAAPLALLAAPSLARADEPPTPVAPVTVTAAPGSLTQPAIDPQRREVFSTAGSVGFVDAQSFQGRYANTLRDVLKDAPGVFVETRYGQELRLSIRGSGIGRAFHLRGIEVLQDGVPWNLADGSGDFYEIDPNALRSIEIYKGGDGLRYGSSALGGAINVVTPTAYTAVTPNALRLEGGSFSTARASATVSGIAGAFDGLATVTGNTSAGSRQHSRSNDLWLNANLGWRLSDTVETRLYLSAADTRQQLPGTLTLQQALDHPDQAAQASAARTFAGNQQRNDTVQRIADRTTVKLADGVLEADVFAYHKHLYHPIFQVIHQDGWTWGGGLRWTGDYDVGGLRDQLIAGAKVEAGYNHAKQFVNFAGARANDVTTGNAAQKSTNVEGYVENRLFVTPTVALMAGATYLADERRLDNRLAPAKSGDKTFYGLNPKVGVLWQARPGVQLFADATRSRDVPDFSDIAQTNTAGQSFVPLRAQTAWTYEAGARGRAGPARFDLTLYRADVRGELLQFLVDPDVPATTFNAGHTLHQGVEASVTLNVAKNLTAPDACDGLSVTALWNLNAFTFRGDRQYGDNAIAGTPHDVLRFAARYTRPHLMGLANAYLAPQVDWVPEGAWADQANTTRVPGYTLLGVEAGFDLPHGLSVYVEGRNLADIAYVSDVGPVTSLTLPTTSKAIYYPGDRRSVFAGVRLAF